jgi:hypothetical protein
MKAMLAARPREFLLVVVLLVMPNGLMGLLKGKHEKERNKS